jgi:hypothetical protein
MSHYGITAIHWNADINDIDEVQLHKVVRQAGDNGYALRRGERVACADVAKLIHGGDTVWVMVDAGLGRYRNTDRVGTKDQLGHAHLFSCAQDDSLTSLLITLPRYRKVDDLPRR